MITFQVDDSIFVYRVVGIAIHNGHVLLHRAENEDFWALPGGRAEIMEPSTDTLRREMMEELTERVRVGKLAYVIENFFVHRGRRHHEMGIYYMMTFNENSKMLELEKDVMSIDNGTELTFRWFRLDEIEGIEMYPAFFKSALLDLRPHPVHRIVIDS